MHGTVKLGAWEAPKDEAVVIVRKNSVGDEVSPRARDICVRGRT